MVAWGVDDLAASDGAISRLRLGLEATRPIPWSMTMACNKDRLPITILVIIQALVINA